MQICDDRKICNAHVHARHFQSCFEICDALNSISRWICDAIVLANMHYTTDCKFIVMRGSQNFWISVAKFPT